MRDENFYNNMYNKVTNSFGVSILHRIAHTKLEKGLERKTFKSVLEIGANQGEHLPYVMHNYDEYTMTDISYEATAVSLGENGDFRVRKIYADAQNLPFPNETFDRVVMTCVLHHLTDPVLAMNEMRRVVKRNGLMSIHLSGDPTILYRLLWALGSGRVIQKLGVNDPKLIHSLEHRGHFFGINTMLIDTFKSESISSSSFPLKGDLTLFKTFQITKLSNGE